MRVTFGRHHHVSVERLWRRTFPQIVTSPRGTVCMVRPHQSDGATVTRTALTLALTGLGAGAAQAQTVNRWIQYGPNNTVLARAITTGASCPSASIGGTPLTLNPRSAPNATFPILECEAQVPAGTGAITATLDGVALKLPVAQPRRIVVVGDTGCRLKGAAVQACNDPTQFPFARIANFVASFRPDMIVHVGDYYYRENACPAASAGNGTTTGCGGSPYGDQWTSWSADWFTPAQALMNTAPLALVRGNHESCARGNKGWFTLLDPSPYTTAEFNCTAGSAPDFTTPYYVNAGQVQFLMFDSSYANDSAVTANTVSMYTSQLYAALQQAGTLPTIFVSHKPSYGLISSSGTGSSTVVSGGDYDEQALFASGVPSAIKLLLSGHIHNFQAVKVSNAAYAPQLVVGNSGTQLDPDYVPGNTAGGTYTMPGAGTSAAVVSTSDLSEFGFAVMDLVPGGYTVNLYDLTGTPHGRCVVQLTSRNLVCTN